MITFLLCVILLFSTFQSKESECPGLYSSLGMFEAGGVVLCGGVVPLLGPFEQNSFS